MKNIDQCVVVNRNYLLEMVKSVNGDLSNLQNLKQCGLNTTDIDIEIGNLSEIKKRVLILINEGETK